jgi:hypothetical protein
MYNFNKNSKKKKGLMYKNGKIKKVCLYVNV